MRLKLNKTLRAALIAAITVVGTTLPQAQASSWQGESILSGNWFYTHSRAHDLLEATDVDTINLTADGDNIVASITTVIAKDGGTLRIVGGNAWGSNRSFEDLQIDTLKAGAAGTGQVTINTQQYNASCGPEKATATIKAVEGTVTGVDNYAILTLGSAGKSISTSGTIHNYDGATLTLYGSMSAANVTVDSGSTLKLANDNLLTVSGDLTMAAGSIMDVSLISASDTPVVLGTYTGSAVCDGVQIVGAQKGYSASLSASGNQLLLTFAAAKPLVWKGTADQHNWSDSVWDEGKTFPSGGDADFTSEGYNEASITSAVTANFVTVGGKDYTFNLSEQGSLTVAADLTVDGVKLSITGSGTVSASNIYASDATIDVASGTSLTAVSLIAEDGKKASIAGQGNITLSSLVGAIDIAEGTTVATNGNVTLSSSSTLNVTGPGTLRIGNMTANGGTHTLGSGLSMGDLEIGGGTNVTFAGKLVSISGKVHTTVNNNTTLAFGSGESATTVVVGRLELDDAQHGGTTNFIVREQAKLVVKSSNNETGYKNTGLLFSEWGQSTHAQISGKLYAKDTMLSTGDKAAIVDISGVLATKGIRGIKNVNNTINLAEGGKLVLGDSGITSGDGSWAINLNGGEVGISANATIARALNVAGNVTFNTQLYTWNGSDAAQEIAAGQDGGNMTITGNITGNGTITKTGAGELILSGGTNVINNTIQVQEGTLTMTGTYEIGGIKGGDIQEYYVDVNGEKATNGFYCQAGSKAVYSAEGATVNDSGAKYTIGGVEVAVKGGEVTIDPTVDYTTLWVRENSEAFAAYKTKAGDALTKVDMAAGTSVTMDYDTAAITLVMHGDATVNATAATTISSITGWQDNTLTITGTGAVTLLPTTNPITLEGSTKLDVQGTATTNKILLNSDAASLVVGADGDLTISGSNNLTVTKGTVDISGKLYVGHEIDLSNSSVSTGKITLHSGADVTVKDGMWMNYTSAGILLEEGAKFAITGKGVTFIGKEGGLIKAADGKEINYQASNGNAVIKNVIMEATDNITIANQLTNVDLVTGEYTVTLNANADSVKVSNGGTFTLKEGKTVTNITVEDGGTIAGGVDASQVGIAAHGTATFEEGVSDGDVTFGWDAPVQVTNNGEATAKYQGLQDSTMKVSADTLIAAGENPEDTIVVNNEVNVSSIANWGDAALTLTNIGTETQLESIANYGGQVTLQGVTTDPITLADMTIDTGSTVAVYTDEHATTEGTVTINETLAAGGGILLANLEMANSSTLDLSLMDGGMQALTLGSQFTIADGALVTLDEATLAAIAGLVNIGDKVILINQYEDHALTTNLEDGDWSRTHFDLSSITNADYKLYVQDGQIGLVKSSNVPEPTTGTLSLLALMALAARRRRK